MKKISIDVEGITPMLLHNGQTADPLNEFSKELKKVSGKRNKTDEDHALMGDIEWRAGLYWDDKLGVFMPAENLQAMLLAAAKKTKQGAQSIHILVDDDMAIKFKNSTKFDKLEKDPDMRDRRICRVGTAKIARTRPKIPAGWSGTINLLIDVDGIDEDDVIKFAETAGKIIGMGDWRPEKRGRFGKFVVTNVVK
jgi:hypothetical protein